MGWNNSKSATPSQQPKKHHGAAQQIKKKYKIETNILGSGAFGKVFLANSIADK